MPCAIKIKDKGVTMEDFDDPKDLWNRNDAWLTPEFNEELVFKVVSTV
jgi:hypothetical protein